MKILAITLALVATASAAVAAAPRATDVDYLKANRCRGLAVSLPGVVDQTALNDFIRSETRGRQSYIRQRADEEFDRAKRSARSEDRRERLTRELSETCRTFVQPMVAGNPQPTQR